MSCRTLIVGVTALALCAPCIRAQDTQPHPAQSKVVLVKLGPITYPYIAKIAHIQGDVEIGLEVKQDGTVHSAVAVSGPALLEKEATITSQKSQFECRDCGNGLTASHLLFTFKLVDNPDPGNCGGVPRPTGYPADQTFPVTSVSGERVTIVDLTRPCIAENIVIRTRARSWKCLYLWNCAR